jgi:hypothetical protein
VPVAEKEHLMYPTYPTDSAPQPGPMRPSRPQSVSIAVILMYIAAGLTAIGVIIALITVASLKSTIAADNPSLTPTQVNSAEAVGVALVVVIGLIGIGLWVWMAWANGAGKNWARILSTVFFGINTLDLLLQLARPHTVGSLILEVLGWLFGLVIIILLWRRESTAYFKPQL